MVFTSSRVLVDRYPTVVRMVVTMTVRMRVEWRRLPDLLLVPGDRDPVDAAVAIHAGLALDRLLVALEHQLGEAGIGAEVRAVTDRDVRMAGGPRVGLVVDAVHEDAGEQEVGHDGDGRRAEATASFQRVRHRRGRQRDECGLDEPQPARVLEEPP